MEKEEVAETELKPGFVVTHVEAKEGAWVV
jgi:hypothetical protein